MTLPQQNTASARPTSFYYLMCQLDRVQYHYPSNITRQQFELIRPALENFRKRTKPRKYDLYEVFCAVLYVLKTGCQWRQVPGDFPEWRSVYNYYKIWSTKAEPTADSLLEQVLKKLSLLGELTKDVQL